MNRILTLVVLLTLSVSNISAQIQYSSDGLNIAPGNSWIQAAASDVIFDLEDLGRAGKNGEYDLSLFGINEDKFSGELISNTNASNGNITSIINESELFNLLNEFPAVIHYLRHSSNPFWSSDPDLIEAIGLNDQGLMSQGGFSTDLSSIPSTYNYLPDLLFLAVPKSIALNEAVLMTRSTIVPSAISNEEYRTDISEEIILDGVGNYTSPWGDSYNNVFRFVVKKNVSIYNRIIGGDWIFDGAEEKQFIVFRTAGNLMPLACIAVEDWTNDMIGMAELKEAIFFAPNEVLSKLDQFTFAKDAIQIAPNPASDYINISIEGLDQNSVMINWIDAIGNLIQSHSISTFQSENHFSMNTPETSGLYYLQIISGIQISTEKVVVRR